MKGIFRYGLLPESHFELLGLGQLELREAVARVLAAVDSMAALGDCSNTRPSVSGNNSAP